MSKDFKGIDFSFRMRYNIYVRLRKTLRLKGGVPMERFIREFAEFDMAKNFAATVNTEVITRYDWDSFIGRIVKTYRVAYSVS